MQHSLLAEPRKLLQRHLARTVHFPDGGWVLQKFPERAPAARGVIALHRVPVAMERGPAVHAEWHRAWPAVNMVLAALPQQMLFRFLRPLQAKWWRCGFLYGDRFGRYQKTFLPLPACVRDRSPAGHGQCGASGELRVPGPP